MLFVTRFAHERPNGLPAFCNEHHRTTRPAEFGEPITAVEIAHAAKSIVSCSPAWAPKSTGIAEEKRKKKKERVAEFSDDVSQWRKANAVPAALEVLDLSDDWKTWALGVADALDPLAQETAYEAGKPDRSTDALES